jgi:hypothetical protein
MSRVCSMVVLGCAHHVLPGKDWLCQEQYSCEWFMVASVVVLTIKRQFPRGWQCCGSCWIMWVFLVCWRQLVGNLASYPFCTLYYLVHRHRYNHVDCSCVSYLSIWCTEILAEALKSSCISCHPEAAKMFLEFCTGRWLASAATNLVIL